MTTKVYLYIKMILYTVTCVFVRVSRHSFSLTRARVCHQPHARLFAEQSFSATSAGLSLSTVSLTPSCHKHTHTSLAHERTNFCSKQIRDRVH